MLAHSLVAASGWSALENRDLRFIIQDTSSRNLYAVGFSMSELLGYSPKAVSSDVFAIFSSKPIAQIDFFTLCDSSARSNNSCGENQARKWNADELAAFRSQFIPLVESTAQPILFLANHSEDIAALPETVRKVMFSPLGEYGPEKFAVYVALHEVFHAFQDRLYLPMSRSFSFSHTANLECAKSILVRNDLNNWAALFRDVPRLKEFDFKQRLAAALSLRMNARKKGNICFEGNYRIEGAANYFALKQMIRAGLVSTRGSVDFVNSIWLLSKHSGLEMTYYEYGYGPAMGAVLDRLDKREIWQKEINEGRSFEEAIRTRSFP